MKKTKQRCSTSLRNKTLLKMTSVKIFTELQECKSSALLLREKNVYFNSGKQKIVAENY